MKAKHVPWIGIFVAVVFWLLESVVHRLITDRGALEFIPRDPDELWMRALVFALIIALGFVVSHAKSAEERHLSKLADRLPEEIAERLRAEEDLRRSERRYRLAEMLGKFGHWERDFVTGKSLHSTGAFLIFGIDGEGFDEQGKRFLDFVHGDDRSRLETEIVSTFNRQTRLTTNFRLIRPDGEEREIEFIAEVYRDENDEPRGLVGTYLDITDRRRAEAALIESEERLRTLFNSTRDWIVLTDPRANVIWANAALRKAIGALDVPSGGTLYSMIHPEDAQKLRVAWQALVNTGAAINGLELRYQFRDTDYDVLECDGYAVQFQREPHYFVIARDITARKRASLALAASEQRYRDLVDYSPDVIWRTDPEGNFTFFSPSAKTVIGYQPEELVGTHVFDLVTDLRNDETLLRNYRRLRQGKIAPQVTVMEINHPRKDGTTMLAEVTATPITDDDGEIIEIQGITRDVTQRRRLDSELQKMEKLEAVGVLAGGIAHDLNNLLTVIEGNLSLVQISDARADRDDALDSIQEASHQIKDLTQQLLTFAKGGAPLLKATDIANILTESVQFSLRGSNVSSDVVFQEKPWMVDVDAGQIHQVLNNLVINARQAMPDGGSVRLSTENVSVSEHSELPLAAGRYLKVSIQDTGTGIPGDQLDDVFAPFFTTKATGSGLGLATTYSIIQQHRGWIGIQSEVGKGTTVQFYLPASAAQEPVSPQPASETRTGGGRILVMDDEPAIRKMIVRLLAKVGYDVVTASHGNEALEQYRAAIENGTPFDAVILDLTVPGGMGGVEALARLREIDPDVRAIVSSGYSNDPVVAEHRHHGFKGYVSKPYTIDAISHVLSEVLAATH